MATGLVAALSLNTQLALKLAILEINESSATIEASSARPASCMVCAMLTCLLDKS